SHYGRTSGVLSFRPLGIPILTSSRIPTPTLINSEFLQNPLNSIDNAIDAARYAVNHFPTNCQHPVFYFVFSFDDFLFHFPCHLLCVHLLRFLISCSLACS